MEEKTILFAVLGVVVFVAVIGFISAMNTKDTGMVYIDLGQYARGAAIRSSGSGTQDAVSYSANGIFRTAGEGQIPTGSKRDERESYRGQLACIFADENGQVMYYQNGAAIEGVLVPTYLSEKSTTLKCTKNYFSGEVGYIPDHDCCMANPTQSSLYGSTGAAYRS